MLKLVNPITILAIDTSCDETSVAVTRGAEVLANSLYSQLELHKQYGGVVPNLARLAHQEKFASVLKEALDAAGITLSQIDAVAVTQGPGLAIALEVGITKAKEIAAQINVPLLGINHMEGHMLSALAESKAQNPESKIQSDNLEVNFPALSLLVSGGHTEFVEVEGVNHYRKLGGTVDDACGEAFDKCARMLGLPYPGGPLISKLAEQYRAGLDIKFERQQKTLFARGYKSGVLAYELPVPMAYSGDLNVSYSGLKTAVKQLIARLKVNTGAESELPEQTTGEVAAVFEAAAIRMLTLKLEQAIAAAPSHGEIPAYSEVWLGGGVVASDYFRSRVAGVCKQHGVTLRMPANKKLMTDNAGMIGVAAGLKVNQLLQESAVANLAELNSDVLLGNAIYLVPAEFSLLDRDPILSF